MKKIDKILNDIIIYLTIIIFDFSFIIKILDSDLYFDLRSAKDLLTYGFDFKDHMSMFDGFKYYYHHWLYDLIIYPIFNIGSYPLLFIFIFTLFIIFSLLIYNFINNNIKSKLISLLSTCLLIIMIGNFFLPRVQSLNYVVMLLQFITIYKLYTTGKKRYSIISIILSIFLVNIHFPLWILVPVFYLPYIVQTFMNYIKKKYNFKLFDKKIEILECKNTKLFYITFIIVLFTCLVSPYGLLPYIFGFEVRTLYNSVYSNIGEMREVVVIGYKNVLICFGLLIITLLSNKKITLSNLLYLLGLGLFGIMVVRNLPYLYTYYIIIIAITLFNKTEIKVKDYFKKYKINKEVIKGTCILLLSIFLIMNIYALDLKNYQYGIQEGGEPAGVADYISTNYDYKNLKFYNEFNIGSYLAYRDIPTFVDSRIEVYLERFNGKQDVMKDYFVLKPNELLNKYKFDYIITAGKSDMYDYMKNNNYEIVYSEYNYYHVFKNKEV